MVQFKYSHKALGHPALNVIQTLIYAHNALCLKLLRISMQCAHNYKYLIYYWFKQSE